MGLGNQKYGLCGGLPKRKIFKHELLFFCNGKLCRKKQNYGYDKASEPMIKFQFDCVKVKAKFKHNTGLNLGLNIRINIRSIG